MEEGKTKREGERGRRENLAAKVERGGVLSASPLLTALTPTSANTSQNVPPRSMANLKARRGGAVVAPGVDAGMAGPEVEGAAPVMVVLFSCVCR